jgi:hypothetical protein
MFGALASLPHGVPERQTHADALAAESGGRFYMPVNVMNHCAAEAGPHEWDENQYALVRLIEPRLLHHPQRTTDLAQASAVYVSLGLFAQMKQAPARASKVDCNRCWHALQGLFAKLAERPELHVFTAVGNVYPSFYWLGDRVNLPKVSTTPESCFSLRNWLLFRNQSWPDVHVMAIEGFDVQTEASGKCVWKRDYNGHPPATQDWSLSVAYSSPRAKYGVGRIKLSSGSDEVLRAYQRELRSETSIASRTELCAFVGSLKRDPLRRKVTNGCRVEQSGHPGDPQPQDVYLTAKFCLQPPGTTPSRTWDGVELMTSSAM